MSTRTLALLLGKNISFTDDRSGFAYVAPILDAKASYGKVRLSVADGTWFEPTDFQVRELKAMGVAL